MKDQIERVKTHMRNNKAICIGIVLGTLAGITACIVRDSCRSQDIQGGTTVLAKGGTTVLGKSTVMNTVSYFSAERQGPPSWVQTLSAAREL